MTVGPDVRNFDQIKVGDTVTARYVEALTLTLKKDGNRPAQHVRHPWPRCAPAGERPAGAVGRQVEVTANVTAVDPKTQTVTLQGPKQTVELGARSGQFKLIKGRRPDPGDLRRGGGDRRRADTEEVIAPAGASR